MHRQAPGPLVALAFPGQGSALGEESDSYLEELLAEDKVVVTL